MATVVEIDPKEHDPSLADSDTGRSLKAKKVVDITDDCPAANNKRRAVLLFTKAKRGRIVQICRPYEGEKYMGMRTHFFVDELNHEMRVAARDDTFGSFAKDLGLTKTQLRELIEEHAPSK